MEGINFLEAFLAGNPVTAPLILVSKAQEALRGGKTKQEEGAKKSSTPVVPAGGAPSNEPTLPTQQPIPPGGASGADLPALLETLIRLQTQEGQASREAQRQESQAAREALAAEAQLAREFYPEKAQIDIETYRQQADIASQAGMEKMRESTARAIELQTINAWQNITQAQINRDTAMGLGMMQLAYTAGMPNPNILQGAASLAAQGRGSFSTPTSIIQ